MGEQMIEPIWSVEIHSYTHFVRAPNAQIASQRAVLRVIQPERVHRPTEEEIDYYLSCTGMTIDDIR